MRPRPFPADERRGAVAGRVDRHRHAGGGLELPGGHAGAQGASVVVRLGSQLVGEQRREGVVRPQRCLAAPAAGAHLDEGSVGGGIEGLQCDELLQHVQRRVQLAAFAVQGREARQRVAGVALRHLVALLLPGLELGAVVEREAVHERPAYQRHGALERLRARPADGARGVSVARRVGQQRVQQARIDAQRRAGQGRAGAVGAERLGAELAPEDPQEVAQARPSALARRVRVQQQRQPVARMGSLFEREVREQRHDAPRGQRDRLPRAHERRGTEQRQVKGRTRRHAHAPRAPGRFPVVPTGRL